MSMFNDIDGTRRGDSEKCMRGHWSFPGAGDEEKWHGTHNYKPEGKGDSIAAVIVGHFEQTGHPVFKGISSLNRGILIRNGGRCTVHFNADSSNTELLFRTIHSANQLSIKLV